MTIPLGALTAVTGVSGAGTSTLVEEVLHRALARRLYRAGAEPGLHRTIEGAEAIADYLGRSAEHASLLEIEVEEVPSPKSQS